MPPPFGDETFGDVPWGDAGGSPSAVADVLLTIGSAVYTDALLKGSSRVRATLQNRATYEFRLWDDAGAFHIPIGAPVEFWWDGVLRFAGTVDDVEEVQPGGTDGLFYEVSCVDWNQLCDRELVAQVYEHKTLKEIVQDLVDQYLADDGVQLDGFMADGPTFAFESFNYVTVADALNRLGEKSGFMWRIDYLKTLRLFEREVYNAPWGVASASPTYRRCTVKSSRQQYRNRQYIRAGLDLTDPFTETQAGDGEKRTWVMPLPVGEEPTITVNGGSVTVGIRQAETGFQFYWQKGSNEITQDTGEALLAVPDLVAVTMRGQFPILVQAQRGSEIAARAAVEGGSGLYEAIQDERDLERSEQAENLAMGLLDRFGTIPTTLDLETDVDGLEPSHLVQVTLAAHGITGQTYLTDQVELQDVAGILLRFKATLLSGDHLGGWVEFFRALADAKREKTPRENELLMLLRDTEETLTLTEVGAGVEGTAANAAWKWTTAQWGYSEWMP